MLILIIGGSGSGKSEYAEKRLLELDGKKKIYLATMDGSGEEGKERIRRHRALRAQKGFVTVEKQRNLQELALEKDADVLLEDLGNLAANEVFAEEFFEAGQDRRAEEISRLKSKRERAGAVLREELLYMKQQAKNFIVVTNDIFSDGTVFDGDMLLYQKILADCNRFLAREADEVIEVVCGAANHIK